MKYVFIFLTLQNIAAASTCSVNGPGIVEAAELALRITYGNKEGPLKILSYNEKISINESNFSDSNISYIESEGRSLRNLKSPDRLSALLDRHPYIPPCNSQPQEKKCKPQLIPAVYQYGGKPIMNGIKINLRPEIKASNEVLKLTGIDCSGYVSAALLRSGLKPKKKNSKFLLNSGDFTSLGQPELKADSCFHPSLADKGSWMRNRFTAQEPDFGVRPGDIFAYDDGHVAIVHSAGSDPFNYGELFREGDSKHYLRSFLQNYNTIRTTIPDSVKRQLAEKKFPKSGILVSGTDGEKIRTYLRDSFSYLCRQKVNNFNTTHKGWDINIIHSTYDVGIEISHISGAFLSHEELGAESVGHDYSNPMFVFTNLAQEVCIREMSYQYSRGLQMSADEAVQLISILPEFSFNLKRYYSDSNGGMVNGLRKAAILRHSETTECKTTPKLFEGEF